jgi:predicted 2-oxoglutarate/Fe(II)-dependent dioxygenase YbiX
LDDDDKIVDMPVIISIDEDQNIENTIVSNSFLNRELFENILYKNDKTAMYNFKKIIKPNIYSYKFIKQNAINTEKTIKLKNLSLKNEINEIINSKNKYNRFIQRFQYNKIYTPDMCRYIINECEKYAATNNGWTTDLQVDKISSIFSLILISLTTIIEKIKKSYNLDDEVLFDVNELFVVKYEHDKQNNLEMHNNVSFFLFNILLSDQNDFEEGETYFEDGLTTYLEQGDLLIHSSHTKHSNKSITKGVQYVLVGFLDIKIKE